MAIYSLNSLINTDKTPKLKLNNKQFSPTRFFSLTFPRQLSNTPYISMYSRKVVTLIASYYTSLPLTAMIGKEKDRKDATNSMDGKEEKK